MGKVSVLLVLEVLFSEKIVKKSKYFGVHPAGATWAVSRFMNKKTRYGRTYAVEEDAAKASDALVFEHLENGGKLKSITRINFPNEKISKLHKTTRNRIWILGSENPSISTFKN